MRAEMLNPCYSSSQPYQQQQCLLKVIHLERQPHMVSVRGVSCLRVALGADLLAGAQRDHQLISSVEQALQPCFTCTFVVSPALGCWAEHQRGRWHIQWRGDDRSQHSALSNVASAKRSRTLATSYQRRWLPGSCLCHHAHHFILSDHISEHPSLIHQWISAGDQPTRSTIVSD